MLKKAVKLIRKLPKKERRITLATKITIIRGLLIPGIIVGMVFQNWGLAFWLFVLASITDILDGGIARFRNEQTTLGACLDPIVDKLLVLSVYFTLAFIDTPLFVIPKWFCAIVLTKELLLVCGVVYLFYRNGFFKVHPSKLGKSAMLVQICFISWLFSCHFFNWMPVKTYSLMISLVLIFVTLSFFHYIYTGFRSYLSGVLI